MAYYDPYSIAPTPSTQGRERADILQRGSIFEYNHIQDRLLSPPPSPDQFLFHHPPIADPRSRPRDMVESQPRIPDHNWHVHQNMAGYGFGGHLDRVTGPEPLAGSAPRCPRRSETFHDARNPELRSHSNRPYRGGRRRRRRSPRVRVRHSQTAAAANDDRIRPTSDRAESTTVENAGRSGEQASPSLPRPQRESLTPRTTRDSSMQTTPWPILSMPKVLPTAGQDKEAWLMQLTKIKITIMKTEKRLEEGLRKA